MSACRIDADASPQFQRLREYWKRHGYPRIDEALAEAFTAIRDEVNSNHCAVMPRFGGILGNFFLHKYRQKDKAAREGARGGYRIIALFDKTNAVLYPIIVYPKKEMENADDQTIIAAVKEMLAILKAPGSYK